MAKNYGTVSDSRKTPMRDTYFAVIKHRLLNNHDKFVQEYRLQDGESIKKNKTKSLCCVLEMQHGKLCFS